MRLLNTPYFWFAILVVRFSLSVCVSVCSSVRSSHSPLSVSFPRFRVRSAMSFSCLLEYTPSMASIPGHRYPVLNLQLCHLDVHRNAISISQYLYSSSPPSILLVDICHPQLAVFIRFLTHIQCFLQLLVFCHYSHIVCIQ